MCNKYFSVFFLNCIRIITIVINCFRSFFSFIFYFLCPLHIFLVSLVSFFIHLLFFVFFCLFSFYIYVLHFLIFTFPFCHRTFFLSLHLFPIISPTTSPSLPFPQRSLPTFQPSHTLLSLHFFYSSFLF